MSIKTLSKLKYFGLLILFICGFAFGLDKEKYISIDEIKRGMDAYCFTVLAGTEPKKYPLKVVSVVRGMQPGQDRILVMGTDEAFKHVGPVQGCSGSPVYIDGRMAGALSAGWGFSTDPLYAVTPISEMLAVGSVADSQPGVVSREHVGRGIIDFSKPIDLSAAGKAVLSSLAKSQKTAGGFTALPCPLVTSFSPEICSSIAGDLKPAGLVPLAGAGASPEDTDEEVKYVPGGVLSIPLVSGDISMAAVGTVTEVAGDKVYGFGHSFLGQGAVDLPMAAGQVHTVVSSMQMSFKLASASKISGAFRADESSGIFGKVGETAKLIPLRIKVARFDAPEDRVYNCKVANHRLYTPMLLQAVIGGAGQVQGPLPGEHTVEYKCSIGVKGYDPIKLENTSSGRSLGDAVGEPAGIVALLLDNSFGDVDVESLDIEINIKPDNLIANFSSVQLDDVTVKAGGAVDATVVLHSMKSEKTAYRMSLPIPKDIRPGKYKVITAGQAGYNSFVRKVQPYKFTARDVDSMISALRYIASSKRDRLYMLLQLPAGGVTIEGKELPDLPNSKAMLLRSKNRTIITQPLGHWIEKSKQIPAIVGDGKVMEITVEK